MAMDGFSGPQEQLDYYYLVRNIIWRYRLDEAEDAVIQRIAALLEEMRAELSGRILFYRPEQYSAQRIALLLEEVELYLAATRIAVTKTIAEASGAALEASLTEQADILSIGGRAANVQRFSMGTAELGSLLLTTPLGGKSLQGWVEAAFADGQDAIMDAIQSAMLQGEGYRKTIRRVMREATDITMREAVTLTRTYVQTASVAAQEAVYDQNKNILGWVEWCAVLEASYKQTGRGTCLRCASLDGTRYRLEEKRPDCPLHPRCRCLWKPIVDWKRLGIPDLELEKAVRPYAIHENKNIDAGGKRKILEVDMHKGDWASWASGRDIQFQVNALGPQRYALWRDSGLSFEDFTDRMVNRQTGELYTVQQLGARL